MVLLLLHMGNHTPPSYETPVVTTNITNAITASTPVLLFLFSLYITLAVFILIGNLLTILAILKNPKLRTQPHLYIANLAVADFLVGIGCFHAAFSFPPFSRDTFRDSVYLCTVVFVLSYTCGCESIHTLLAISVDRLFYIVYPFTHARWFTESRTKVFLGLSWLASLVVGAEPMYEYALEKGATCGPMKQVPSLFNNVVLPVHYLGGLLVAAVCYGKIACVAHGQREKTAMYRMCSELGPADQVRRPKRNGHASHYEIPLKTAQELTGKTEPEYTEAGQNYHFQQQQGKNQPTTTPRNPTLAVESPERLAVRGSVTLTVVGPEHLDVRGLGPLGVEGPDRLAVGGSENLTVVSPEHLDVKGRDHLPVEGPHRLAVGGKQAATTTSEHRNPCSGRRYQSVWFFVTVNFAHFVCYLPFFVQRVLFGLVHFPDIAVEMGVLFAFANSVVNVVILTAKNKAFARAYQEMLKNSLCWRRRGGG